MTWKPGEIHHVKIRSTSDRPLGYDCTVEIDGEQDKTITDLKVNIAADGYSTITLTMRATVDIDVPAKLALPPDPDVAEVKRLAPLKPGDTVILEVGDGYTLADMEYAEVYLKAKFPDNEVAVITGGTLKVSGALPVATDN